MERHSSDHAFHVGERFTIADIALYAYTHVAGEGGFDLAGYPAIRAWLDRVAAQPRSRADDGLSRRARGLRFPRRLGDRLSEELLPW